jgi:hypothetical protein
MAGQRSPLPVRGLHGPSSGQPSRRWRKPSSCRHRLPTLTRTVAALTPRRGTPPPLAAARSLRPSSRATWLIGLLVERTSATALRLNFRLYVDGRPPLTLAPRPQARPAQQLRNVSINPNRSPPTPPHVRRTGLAARGSAPVARRGEGHLNQGQLMPGHRTGSPARRASLGVVLALPAWRSDQASVVTAATPERQRDTKGGGHGHDTQYPSPAEQDAGGSFVRGKPDLQSIGM